MANDLSARHARILALGVHGGSDDDPESTEPPAADEAAPPAEPVEGSGDEGSGDEGAAEATTTEPVEGTSTAFDIPALAEDLTSVDEADLRSQFDSYEALFQEQRASASPASIEALETVRAHQSAIAAELKRRRDEAEATAQRLAALDETAPEIPEAVPVPALASAAAVVAGREKDGSTMPSEPTTPAITRPRAALVAAAGSNVVTAGSEMSLADLGASIDSVSRGSAGRSLIASIPGFDQMDGMPEPLSNLNTAERNTELAREAQDDFMALSRGERPAKTAAICEPLDILREIPDNFNASEPVASSLPSRPAGRLGFTHLRSIALSDVVGGAAEWTEQDQASVDPDDSSTWKPCVEVDCPTPVDVKARAVTVCLTFDNTTEMSNPETVRNYMNALDALRARTKEARILAMLDSLCSAYTYVGQYGALPTLVEAINYAVSQATYADRQDGPNFTLYISPLLASLLRIDRADRAYGADASTGDVMSTLLSNCDGVNRVVQTLDATAAVAGEPSLPPAVINPPGQAAIPLPSTSGGHRIRLIDPRNFIYAETGKRDTGVQRSPELMRQNRAQLFGEEYFLLDYTGPWVDFVIDVTLCADGSRAGLIEPVGCSSTPPIG